MPVPPSYLIGLIGAGIQGSLTPTMHEREADHQGLRYLYKLIDLDVLGLDVGALPDLLAAAERLGFDGLNITFPCKQAILPLLDELSPDAAAIGAVNTVVLRNRRRVGHNTDCWGFAESFHREMPGAALERVMQFGAGGAGAAVAAALLGLGVGRLTLFDIEPGRAQALVAALAARFGAGRVAAVDRIEPGLDGANGLVNATPIGMEKCPGMPLPAQLIAPHLWIADVIYFPAETELLRTARQRGCRTLSGEGMAVFQAVGAFQLFTGLAPDAERMRQHFNQSRPAT